MDVPVIDLSDFDAGDPAKRAAIARAWADAFETIGFATIIGHGIDEALMDRLYALAQRFFDLPLADKRECSFLGDQRSQGYVPPDMETVAATFGQTAPPDLCESISFSHLDRDLGMSPSPGATYDHRPNLWPSQIPEFRTVAVEYYRLAYDLVRRLMRINALALDLPEDYFTPFYTDMGTTLRLVDYPDQPAEPLPGQLRYGAHTDFGCFTVLRQDDAPGGLQVQTPDGAWVDVRPTKGALIINAGDTMARWTNDRFRSNIHRVINPPRHLTGSTRRLSIVLFSGPNHDAIIDCLPTCRGADRPARYEPIAAGEYINRKIRENMPKPLE